MKTRTPNPNRARANATADFWYDVQYMDVELHISKKGHDCVKVVYSCTEEKFGIQQFFLPTHPHEYPRQLWRDYAEEVETGTGYKIKGNDAKTIVNLSGDWPQPCRIGCFEEYREGFRNVVVVEYDWKQPNADTSGDLETEEDVEDEEDDLPF